MEVLLFALFFISALIFFIAGKDDFGRTESKSTIKGEEKVPKEIKKEDKVAEEVKKEDKIPEENKKEEKVVEEVKKEDKIPEENKKEEISEGGGIEPQKEPKKE